MENGFRRDDFGQGKGFMPGSAKFLYLFTAL
jgi:hypothetical protein